MLVTVFVFNILYFTLLDFNSQQEETGFCCSLQVTCLYFCVIIYGNLTREGFLRKNIVAVLLKLCYSHLFHCLKPLKHEYLLYVYPCPVTIHCIILTDKLINFPLKLISCLHFLKSLKCGNI